MTKLEPIPAPPRIRWREFRIKGLPVLVWLALVLTSVQMWRVYVSPADRTKYPALDLSRTMVVVPATTHILSNQPPPEATSLNDDLRQRWVSLDPD